MIEKSLSSKGKNKLSDISDTEGSERAKTKGRKSKKIKPASAYEQEFWEENKQEYQTLEEADVQDGDYVYTPIFKGVYYVRKFSKDINLI